MTFNQKHSQQFQNHRLSASSSDELTLYIKLLEKDNMFAVVETLKESDFEKTQLVTLSQTPIVAASTSNCFIRKYLNSQSGLGAVYKVLFEKQLQGVVFSHLPKIFDCYQLGDELVVIMEYLKGPTLEEEVAFKLPSINLAKQVFPSICDAVSEFHEVAQTPIIHRDIKPSNIILTEKGVYIIDFGIARLFQPESSRDTVRFGTRSYAPPEQFGFGQTDVRSDIYALGNVLSYCLCKQPVITQGEKAIEQSIPASIQKVIARASAFDPDNRYRSVKELKSAFNTALESYEKAIRTSDKQPIAPAEEREVAAGHVVHQQENCVKTIKQSKNFSLPTWLGRVWNAWVIFIWVLFIYAGIDLTFHPVENQIQYPLWFRGFEYIGFLGVLTTSTLYFCMDRRRLRARFKTLRALSIWQELLVLILIYVVSFVAFGFMILVVLPVFS